MTDELKVGDWATWIDGVSAERVVCQVEKRNGEFISYTTIKGEPGSIPSYRLSPWSPQPGELCEGFGGSFSQRSSDLFRGTYVCPDKNHEDEHVLLSEYGTGKPTRVVQRAGLRPVATDAKKKEEPRPTPSAELTIVEAAAGVSAPPDPYLVHEHRLTELPPAEREKMLAWYEEQDTLHELRYGRPIWLWVWDWDPPEDFEIFPRPG